MIDIEQIKSTINLRSLISESCKLDSSGRGAHENKHDSESGTCLYVDNDWWYCHHCHAGGDALDWIMDRDGVDFPEALRTAAGIAGIPLDGSDPAAESERRAVFDVLKAAAIHFHENLTDAHRADITARWGITNETIDKLLIGIARNDEALEIHLKRQGFTYEQMVKSGLFFDWNSGLKPHFQGRYVFPYWKGGTVRYMIARQTEHTPKNKWEKAKYKKLLTHDKKHPYVSEHVRNDTLYGVDSLRGVSDWCLVTEGITDCIMALQAGIPCISPVTVRFKKADHKRILKLVKRLETVYLCNDNEDNEAGLKGAISTAEYLEANGITTRLIALPRAEGVEKIDLAEYLRDHGVEEFKALFDTAVSVWNVKLSRQPVGGDAVENVKAAKKFIAEELSAMDAAVRVAFIESDVRAHFGLSDDVVKELVKVTPEAAQTGFDVSPDDFLVGDKKTFDANRFAKWLINGSGFTFVTLPDTEEVLWYDGGVYKDDGSVIIQRIVEQVMDGLKVTKHAVNEVIGHIQRRTYVERDEFDADKRIINLKNGLYDTRTGELKPHTPDYLSTVRIPVAYDPAATCPAIDKFLSDVLDADDIDTAIEWCGYVLEPSYWIQSILMLLGEGGNGKSTFLSLLSAFIGKHNIANESIHNLTNQRFRLASLHGKLANIYADISDRELKETGILKTLSGGDRITVEKKNKPQFEFNNFARLIFSANRLPRAYDDTDAWYRRWTFMIFTRKFGDDPDAVKKEDKKLLDKLTTDNELSGLLNRALDALKGLHERGGFSKNLSTEETRRIYTRLSDPVAVFIEDCCMLDREASVKRSVLFSAYVEFCKVNRQAPIGQAAFTKRIKDMGKFSECRVGSKDNQERGWRGLNIDKTIFDGFGSTLGSTLDDHIKH